MRTLAQTNPTALISIDARPDPEGVAAYAAANAPIVLIEEVAKGVLTIATNNLEGGRLAGEHFLRTGRKRRAIVSDKKR